MYADSCSCCGGELQDLADDTEDWDKIYNDIAQQLLNGEDLNTDAVYNKTASELMAAMHKGLGGTAFDDNDSRKALQSAFKSNLEQFSYAKTLTQFKLFKDAMFNDKGQIQSFETVKKAVFETGEVFNKNYLRAEHQFVTQSAIMANKWETMDAEYLEFTTVGDSRVRPEHKLFDKFTALKSDPIWKRLYTPLSWGCRCTVIPGIAKNLSKEYDSNWANKVVDPLVKGTLFDNNVGITKKIFTDKHPYFKTPGAKEVKEPKEIEYKNYSIDQLKEAYKTQNIDKDKESTIMKDGYVASSNAFSINEKLRNSLALSDRDNKTVDALDDLIKANKLKDNVILYRNVKNDFVKNMFKVEIDDLSITDAINKIKSSGINKITDKAFFSTSAVKTANAFMARKVHLEVLTKKGTNALIVDNYSESEIILGRNQKFKIVDVVEDNNKIKVILETD